MLRDGEIQKERVADADRGGCASEPLNLSTDYFETATSVTTLRSGIACARPEPSADQPRHSAKTREEPT
jgi:hypothetical protein